MLSTNDVTVKCGDVADKCERVMQQTQTLVNCVRDSAADGQPLLVDCTRAVLGANSSFHDQLMKSTNHWRRTLEASLGIDVFGHQGLAIGDANGDGFVYPGDFAILTGNWLLGTGGFSARLGAVPEPSSILLAALGLLVLIAYRVRFV